MANTGETATAKRPSIKKALHAVGNEADVGELDIKFIEIRITASGHAVYRLTPSDSKESVGGLVSID